MGLSNMADLRAGLGRGQRLLGLDPGRRRIGVAISDVSLLVASPRPPIERRSLADTRDHVLAIVGRDGVGGLVIGLPLSLDGTFGPAAQAAKDWGLALAAATNLPAALWDERMSTLAADRLLAGEADLSRRRRRDLVDSVAAAWVLQAALDATAPRP
jgi:putative Holliday junction resolvase